MTVMGEGHFFLLRHTTGINNDSVFVEYKNSSLPPKIDRKEW